LDAALEKEPNPAKTRTEKRQAVWSLSLGIAGWAMLIMTLLLAPPLVKGVATPGQARTFFMLLLGSFLPALVAAGQGAACIRTRGRQLALATRGVSLAGAHLGLLLGLMVLNVWLN